MYLLEISMIYNIKQILVLSLLIIFIPETSVPQVLSIKGGYTSCFSNFLLIGLYNSSTNSWFDIFSFLTAPQEFIF